MRKTIGRSTATKAVTLLVVVIFAAVTAQAQASDKTVIEELLLKSFGATVESVKSFAPYHLTGDFNGDTAADTLIVVRLKARRSELPKDVTVLNPFYKNQGPAYPADPKKEPTLALVIFHGSNPKLPNSAAQKFLLVGPSPVLILENNRASAEPDARKSLLELVKKKGRRPRGAMRPPATAKGDSISLPTEAADSILYWNGKTYRWEESEGAE